MSLTSLKGFLIISVIWLSTECYQLVVKLEIDFYAVNQLHKVNIIIWGFVQIYNWDCTHSFQGSYGTE